MNNPMLPILLAVLICTACNKDETITPQNGTPIVTAEASYSIIVDSDITYAKGLSYERGTVLEKELQLDVYHPDNNANNRPVYMFVHGGGFTGGDKQKGSITDIADYYASRGWVFVSINYRLAGDIGIDPTGIAPQEWIDQVTNSNPANAQDFRKGIAAYAAQRDAKAALRWIVANASNYGINTDYITIGGGSAGSTTVIAIGVSEAGDFKDEISIEDDPTLSTTNLNETYEVRSIINHWGSDNVLSVFENLYGLNRFDRSDPEMWIAHGTDDPIVPYSEAENLKNIYDSLDIYSELVTLQNKGHGAWNVRVDGNSLQAISFNFLVDRQNLILE